MSVRYAEELLLGEEVQAGESALGLTVGRAIRRALPQHSSFGEVAASLYMSERTLRRRLMESGLSYRKMQDEERKSRALSLVLNGQTDLTAVVRETGFADISNFRRSFKRWTGMSPNEMRRKSP